MNQFRRSIVVNFLPQTVDVDFNKICFAVEVAIPNVFHDFAACNKIRSADQEELKEREFFGSKGNYFLTACNAALVTIQHEVSVAESCIPAMEAPSNECPHPCEEFRQNEGLREIVVRTGVQPFHSLFDQTASREHQHGRLNPSLAQFAANFHAIDPRQPNVQKNGVVKDLGD